MEDQFKNWLKELITVWESRNPDGVINLVAENFIWHDAPLDKPISTKEMLVQEWQSVLDHEDVKVTCEVLNVENNIGIAHWHATFTRLPSKENTELDGIYKVTLDKNGKCIEFHQWYNSK
jgi:hypothetical protein